MEILVTHVGADFDGFASMLVARRLHPEARLLFPGSREGSLRRMLDARGIAIEELRHRDVDPAALRRVILCDTRQRERLGVVAQWLDEHPGIEVVAYDHHPDGPGDVDTTGGVVDAEVGATSTLIAELLRQRGLAVEIEEATLLLMGIYEDTGALSYPTTSPRDLQAAAWLLEQGGELDLVRRFALHSLDRLHLEVLHRMTHELEVVRVRGRRVGIFAGELGGYVDELAPLVSRCLELFDLPLLFGVFGESDRVTVIARGRLPGFHLGDALAALVGGGGHETAAAGSVKGATALEVRTRLLAFLEERLPPAARARDLMIHPFVAVPADATVAAAKERLVRTRINAAPVVAGEEAVGAVTRQMLDAALQHDLAARPVTTVMRRELVWVRPETPADELGSAMVGQQPRFVLVGEAGSRRPLGVVTRMAVLRHLHARVAESAAPEIHVGEQKTRHLGAARLLAERVSPDVRGWIDTLAAVSRRTATPAYLVGGFVRDLLLQREDRDLDVVVEGDGPAFARAVAAELQARVRVHEAFLTATVELSDGGCIDVATARSEFYRAPAVLPEVESSALQQDLYRRDFTVNTLALRLGPPQLDGDAPPGSGEHQAHGAFEIIDFFGGRRDLKDRILRVLHSLSFIDDPTRVLRAVRLALRLDFHLSHETLRLVAVAVEEGIFDRLSGGRLRDELQLLLDDPATAVRGLEWLDALGVAAAIHPALRLDPARLALLRETRAAFDWYRLGGLAGGEGASFRTAPARLWLLLLVSLGRQQPLELRRSLGERLQLGLADRQLLERCGWRLERAERALAAPSLLPHEAHGALAELAEEELLALFAGGDEGVREWVRRELVELRQLRLAIGGRDLLAAGHPAGPAIGRALRATLDARLDGAIAADAELAYALAQLGRGAEASVGGG